MTALASDAGPARFTLYCDPSERDAMDERAEAHGMSRSQWVRCVLLRELDLGPPTPYASRRRSQ